MRRRAGALAERVGSLHETDPGAVMALIEAERTLVPSYLWEPCCGHGAIVKPLRAAGWCVYASDVIADGWGGQNATIDFLTVEKAPRESRGIITNCPYENAALFVRHALSLDRINWAAFLLPLAFWEAGNGATELARARRFVLDEHPPARCWIFRNRLPRMHREGWTGSRTTSMEPFAWFVWDDRYPVILTAMKRITWRPFEEKVSPC